MRTLLVVVVLLAVGVAGYGFYRGWFQLSTNNTDQKTHETQPSVTFTMDKDKIHADEEKLKEFGHGAKEKPGDQSDKVKP
jgi:hypothetical protein